jgi:hypothetical protein
MGLNTMKKSHFFLHIFPKRKSVENKLERGMLMKKYAYLVLWSIFGLILLIASGCAMLGAPSEWEFCVQTQKSESAVKATVKVNYESHALEENRVKSE